MKQQTIGMITLFPDMFKALDFGVTGRACERGLLNLSYWNPRDHSDDKHRRVDDRSYGGGPGMVMMAPPLLGALTAAKQTLGAHSKVIYLTPKGRRLQQNDIKQLLAEEQTLILIAGRYEGIDQRFIDSHVDTQYSVGDFVLSGGELAAMVIIDALARLIPGALGHERSAQEDSFSEGLLDHPHYTRPLTFCAETVPEVLRSGDHKAIRRWRRKEALKSTWQQRPDLIASLKAQDLLTEQDEQLLNEISQVIKKY